ncbi:Mov34/MPN/PAD-1 family protein [Geoglobus acetivorans]|uniref:M67 family metallopeptidase n=1 Tax=Geoglobus acetivorans TaxID=565033 RepID=A0ABZ3H4P3_GEOAI|nr:M67 family metallopeptidase [Geoglobus acetivorans]
MKFKISRDVWDFLRSVEQKDFERCGLLFGRGDSVLQAIEIENIKKSPVEFELSPLESLKAFEEAEEKNLEVVGVWHTHLQNAVPSAKDIRGMRNFPGLWIIMSRKEIRGYVLEQEVVEVELEIL